MDAHHTVFSNNQFDHNGWTDMDVHHTVYSSAVFNVSTIEQAKRIILTKEGDVSTEQRWQQETPYLLSLIKSKLSVNANSVVLDYGCGIGRMAKALIDDVGCRVVGVDISPSMRALASSYVSSDRFVACSPDALKWLGVTCDAAIAIWALQHCFDVQKDIDGLVSVLKPYAALFVCNDKRRLVPVRGQRWVDDGGDINKMLTAAFEQSVTGELEPGPVSSVIADASYWAAYYNKVY